MPAGAHAPIWQDAILLTKGQDSAAALSLMRYLRGERAKSLIRSYGYDW